MATDSHSTEQKNWNPKWIRFSEPGATATCPKCGVEKPLTADHWVRAERRTGIVGALYVTDCRQCQREYRANLKRQVEAGNHVVKPRGSQREGPVEIIQIGDRTFTRVPSKPKPAARKPRAKKPAKQPDFSLADVMAANTYQPPAPAPKRRRTRKQA